MKIVFFGSGRFGIDSLNALLGSTHRLAFIVTQPARPAGRGRKLQRTPVGLWAEEHSIPCIETDNINKSETIEMVAQFAPELIVVTAFGQKIGREMINLPPKGMINVHASLLPKYRGAAPINWAIINGESTTGVSIITVAEQMDAGDIIAQAQVAIEPDETAQTLHNKLARTAAPLLLQCLDQIAQGTATYTRQDHSKATPAPKLTKNDGFISFGEPASLLERKIRGLWPWPGASAIYQSIRTGKSERVTFALAEVVATGTAAGLEPGTLDGQLNVICGKDALKIKKIKPAGGSLMDFKAFVNGRTTQPGDRFIKIVTNEDC